MNKRVVAVVCLTLVALLALGLYSFGPSRQGRRPSASVPTTLSPPASVKPTLEPAAPANGTPMLAGYHNRDVTENYYSIEVPQQWQAQTGKNLGSYDFSFAGGSGTVELMDVPDNSTLTLYVLSQEEPRLKKALAEYQRQDYRKIEVDGNEAHQLVFDSRTDAGVVRTVRTYIAGQDRAAVVTLAAPLDAFPGAQAAFSAVLASFRWENR
jgi:hypothetical protein